MSYSQTHRDYVPDAETAIKIAVAVWEPIYGKEKLEKDKPFHADLRDDIWGVSGTGTSHTLRGGGMVQAEISKSDGKILKIYLAR